MNLKKTSYISFFVFGFLSLGTHIIILAGKKETRIASAKTDKKIISLNFKDAVQADLQITKTAQDIVTAGALMKFHISVKNKGPAEAKNIVVTDILPKGAIF